MRYLLIAIGTRGDIEPFLATGQLLVDKGHEVLCVFPAQFEALTLAAGLSFSPLDRRFLELLDSEAGRGIMGQKGSGFKRIRQLVTLARESWHLQKVLIVEQQNAINEFSPDRIIYHPKAVSGRIWGMANPGRSFMLSPVPNVLHPSGDYPQIGINAKLGRWGNRLTYQLTNYGAARMTNSVASEVAMYYPNVKFSTSKIKRFSLEKERVVYPISPTIFSAPKEWPDRATITGYLERNKLTSWEPSAAISEFLRQQERQKRPLVFITFGSMVNARPTYVSRLIIKTIEASPYAAIINTSSGGLETLPTESDRILFTNTIPYDFIFPRVYAVIHHGGSGTTHTAVKHGCASMILPHIIDQFFWNRRIHSLGAGPLGIKISKLNHQNFGNLLSDLMETKRYRDQAEALSQSMKLEAAEEELLACIT